jgi:hypothetical protein
MSRILAEWTMEWQHHIADVIRATEESFPHHHSSRKTLRTAHRKSKKPHPAISIFNFHYANPPTAVAQNYGLNKLIGLNETGFKGTATITTEWKRGNSCSQVEDCITISTIRSPPATRTERLSIHLSNPAAETWDSASR